MEGQPLATCVEDLAPTTVTFDASLEGTVAILQSPSGRILSTGMAKLSPFDVPDKTSGELHALARAVFDYGKWLTDLAADFEDQRQRALVELRRNRRKAVRQRQHEERIRRGQARFREWQAQQERKAQQEAVKQHREIIQHIIDDALMQHKNHRYITVTPN